MKLCKYLPSNGTKNIRNLLMSLKSADEVTSVRIDNPAKTMAFPLTSTPPLSLHTVAFVFFFFFFFFFSRFFLYKGKY